MKVSRVGECQDSRGKVIDVSFLGTVDDRIDQSGRKLAHLESIREVVHRGNRLLDRPPQERFAPQMKSMQRRRRDRGNKRHQQQPNCDHNHQDDDCNETVVTRLQWHHFGQSLFGHSIACSAEPSSLEATRIRSAAAAFRGLAAGSHWDSSSWLVRSGIRPLAVFRREHLRRRCGFAANSSWHSVSISLLSTASIPKSADRIVNGTVMFQQVREHVSRTRVVKFTGGDPFQQVTELVRRTRETCRSRFVDRSSFASRPAGSRNWNACRHPTSVATCSKYSIISRPWLTITSASYGLMPYWLCNRSRISAGSSPSAARAASIRSGGNRTGSKSGSGKYR